ncbi:AmmeMemoRadiSam system radical SAM enzyme [Absicoccus intestinalis]|uniref:AmmeMemoRadiSam system radical SAM enzyme n=1 Tax=Absicoccus intestinalis TaxID=2926319 RepID=A0ABU4WL28_9FIRM|nr:AmmeMemoRadiSam system radical SAM enzyme [Absicoccus sp. CLA-KB-P134]MDX8417242.1 AmmeMemoRadiSam system radical SAM enzyme [Absicoccus sp. CLA-KB-P134]
MICSTCFRHCQLQEGQIGFCRARQNKGGKIICANYGYVTSMAIDPIEKKPLALFHPGSTLLSIGSYGCNLDCPFCQNFQISRMAKSSDANFVSPEKIRDMALQAKQTQSNLIGVAYTYNEMLCSWEYVRDCAQLIHKAHLLNVLVTNGTASLDVLDEILPYIDAMNIDLKSLNAQTYASILHGDLNQTMAFIEKAIPACHVEITTLVVPGMNDSESEIDALTHWISQQDPNIPYHLTRYFPRYQMDTPATNISTLYRLKEIAQTHLHHVFVGNV